MRWRKLLAVSRSVRGLSERGPYKLPKQGFLPSFLWSDTPTALPLSEAPAAPAGTPARPPRRGGTVWSGLRQMLARRGKPARSAQGEFGLANVKVVRNDLSDADLELMVVAPVRSRPVAAKRSGVRGKVFGWTRSVARLVGLGRVWR
jgi:hypothetical protein